MLVLITAPDNKMIQKCGAAILKFLMFWPFTLTVFQRSKFGCNRNVSKLNHRNMTETSKLLHHIFSSKPIFSRNFTGLRVVFTKQKNAKMMFISKDAQCSDRNFCINEIFFLRILIFELWSILYLTVHWGRDFC